VTNPFNEAKATTALEVIGLEYTRAANKHPSPMRSQHEGYAVLLEEVDELWEAIKKDDPVHATVEAVHVGAMALRFLIDQGIGIEEIATKLRERVKAL
jgi:hypothetical protein